ncbi:hypothetical protein RF11_13159 [Thelohanellus kitauei]|uniref:Uncharacterized protein n=1 Tax=Thelohanellus kitauei TaxID=669202 RepID=A0A0C2NAR6_THEKT|nr:hypothetical protein RF11_13159 [Thelohanellus kitauei]
MEIMFNIYDFYRLYIEEDTFLHGLQSSDIAHLGPITRNDPRTHITENYELIYKCSIERSTFRWSTSGRIEEDLQDAKRQLEESHNTEKNLKGCLQSRLRDELQRFYEYRYIL